MHAGITLGQDGATHQTMEDIALMCSLPNMSVVAPADAFQTRKLLPSIIEMDSPVYFRLLFPKMKNISQNTETILGKIQTLRQGSELSIFSYGQTVHACLGAAEKLEKIGFNCSVINVHTIKPIDRECVIKELLKSKKALVVEEHNIYGGLWSIIATIASQDAPSKIEFISTNDKFGTIGLPDEILNHYGLNEENIYEKALNLITNEK